LIRLAVLVLTLLPLAASAAAPVSPTMTLAEAKKLSPQQLAERLLGAVGASGGYVEAKVYGDGGGMIASPGLNGIDLYRRPTSAGFAGLCTVEGIHIAFSGSRAQGDPPHRVTDFWKATLFAIIAPTGKRTEDDGGKQQERACAALGPVADRRDPTFFSAGGDSPADAYFVMRALAKMKLAAPGLGSALTCKASNDDPICADPAKELAAFPIRNTPVAGLEKCPDNVHWCVKTGWQRAADTSHEIGVTLRTDATVVDPPSDFNIVAIDISAGTSFD